MRLNLRFAWFIFVLHNNIELLPETGAAKERHDIANLTHQEIFNKQLLNILNSLAAVIIYVNCEKAWKKLVMIDSLKILFGGQLVFQ